jgi:hypothetical protein
VKRRLEYARTLNLDFYVTYIRPAARATPSNAQKKTAAQAISIADLQNINIV